MDKRTTVQEKIYEVVRLIDPSGFNEQRYRASFSKMSDSDFENFMLEIRDKKRTLTIYAPNQVINLKPKYMINAARRLNLQLWERLRIYDEATQRYYTTPHKYMILKLPVRRLKQYLMDKISVPDSDKQIDAFSGQVVKPDKGSSISMVEAQTYDSKGLHISLSEMLTIRGGNLEAYSAMKAQIAETGSASVKVLNGTSVVRSVAVSAAYLNSMHIGNNFVPQE